MQQCKIYVAVMEEFWYWQDNLSVDRMAEMMECVSLISLN